MQKHPHMRAHNQSRSSCHRLIAFLETCQFTILKLPSTFTRPNTSFEPLISVVLTMQVQNWFSSRQAGLRAEACNGGRAQVSSTDLMQCMLFDGFRGCRTRLFGAVNHRYRCVQVQGAQLSWETGAYRSKWYTSIRLARLSECYRLIGVA